MPNLVEIHPVVWSPNPNKQTNRHPSFIYIDFCLGLMRERHFIHELSYFSFIIVIESFLRGKSHKNIIAKLNKQSSLFNFRVCGRGNSRWRRRKMFDQQVYVRKGREN